MATISVAPNKKLGKIKPMHGGGQPPTTSFATDEYFHYLTEAGIPYSRLHDVGGAFGCGKYVDISNIFRNFDADVDDPDSYDFTFTDLLLAQLHKAKVEPYFRLGETIENAAMVKSYRLDVPKDMNKWASICEHIVRHYTKGWANGFNYGITYWEIWGEPDNPPYLWKGTNEDYYRLYEITAKLIKKEHPDVKVGAFGCSSLYNAWTESTGWEGLARTHRLPFFRGFFEYIKKTDTPIDFFSWHSYYNTKETIAQDAYIHSELEKLGYADLETHLNEWDPYCDEFGTAHHSAEVAAMMIAMQNANPSVLCIYDMRNNNAPYCPLFNPITKRPIHAYYSLVAFNNLYSLGTQVELSCDTEDLYALCATDGDRNALLISNLTGKKQELAIEGVDLTKAKYHVIDCDRLLSWSCEVRAIDNVIFCLR